MPEIEKAVESYNLNDYYNRALNLIVSGKTRQAFDLEQEPVPVRDWYGRNTFGQSLPACSATGRGRYPCRGSRLAEGRQLRQPFLGCARQSQPADEESIRPHAGWGLSAPIADLDQRGMLDETMVVAVGEFGRSPREVLALQETVTVMMVEITGRIATPPVSPVGASNGATSTESRTRRVPHPSSTLSSGETTSHDLPRIWHRS